MSPDADGHVTDILYIGRPDPYYDGVWRDLERAGYAVSFARTQTQGIELARSLEPRIVVINIANSQFTGDSLCKALSRRLPGAQLLLIVERGMGDGLRCEQRLVRPFTARKFHQSLIRLLQAASPSILHGGAVHLDLGSRVVTGPNGVHHLTPKECGLLADLLRRPNQVISRKDLMEQVWNTGYLGDTRTLDVHIRWLREKIEPDPVHPVHLITKRGIGYMLVVVVPPLDPDDVLEGEP